MAVWVSLKVGWKLQDVQAGLNVCIAFLCAGGIFVLVRYFWLLAAHRVAKEQDVPAYSLLSLNTIGETIDVIWLLRYDLFASRYQGLLVQVICVILLTVATLLSGFIARWSTRYGTIVRQIQVNGTIAARNTQSIPYAEVETNVTFNSLVEANFPPTQLLEYLPDPSNKWEYDSSQWNSSWSMDCTYNASTPIPNAKATANCTGGLWTEVPVLYNNWGAFRNSKYADFALESTGWRNNGSIYRDWLVFAHGVLYTNWDDNNTLGMTVQTVAYHLMGLNATVPDGCNFGSGKIQSAAYTSMTCSLTRSLDSRSQDDLDTWGAFPDGFDTAWQAGAYLQHYGNRFRKESSRERDVTIIEGPELARFYQAYMITKDISTSPYAKRTILTRIEVAQVSLSALIIGSVGGGFVLFGLFNYWIFLLRHWHRLHATPQSKLDWMLQTLRKESEDPGNLAANRHRLSHAMASGATKGETVPLARVPGGQHDRQSLKSISSSFMNTPEIHQTGDDDFDTPSLGANFSGKTPTNHWFPQQHQRPSPPAQQNSWRVSGRGDYNPIQQQQSPYSWQGSFSHNIDTAYDPARR